MKSMIRKLKKKSSRGTSLIEVIIALGLMVLLFGMFTVFLGSASNMNTLAHKQDEGLSEAEAALYAQSSGSAGTVSFQETGGAAYSYNVTVYEGGSADGSVTVSRFLP